MRAADHPGLLEVPTAELDAVAGVLVSRSTTGAELVDAFPSD